MRKKETRFTAGESGSGDTDYEVGYKKPPKSGQFQKGQSGNPKGKTKGKKATAKEIVERILDTEVVVNRNGVPTVATKRELLYERIINDAIKGQSAMVKLALPLVSDATDSEELLFEINEQDKAEFEKMLQRHDL
jgi:hypothetical protein